MHPRTAPQPVDVRLIGGEIAVRALAESIAATPGSSPASYAPSHRGAGLRAYLSVVVDPADLLGQPGGPTARTSPAERADQAKRQRDLGAEVGALVDGEQALRTAPWYPPRAGDLVHAAFGTGDGADFGETYLVETDEFGELALRLLAYTPAGEGLAGAYAVGPVLGDVLFDLWMEAGPHRLTVVRHGRVVHDGPNAR